VAASSVRTVRVLIAEDAPRLAQLLRRGLQDDGHAVDLASTGPDALWLGQENPYDAILLDVMLPGMSGYEVCERLRAGRCAVPVIMLTARDSVQDRVRGLDLGADDYLTKPFSFTELTARLRAVTRREHPPRPSVLTFNDLTVDPVSHRVWRGETEISLSVKEFALLEYLMRAPGLVRPAPRSSTTSGTSRTTGCPTSSTSTSGICAARLIVPSGGTTCRPSAAAATAWANFGADCQLTAARTPTGPHRPTGARPAPRPVTGDRWPSGRG